LPKPLELLLYYRSPFWLDSIEEDKINALQNSFKKPQNKTVEIEILGIINSN
jgi:hypothetical protein